MDHSLQNALRERVQQSTKGNWKMLFWPRKFAKNRELYDLDEWRLSESELKDFAK